MKLSLEDRAFECSFPEIHPKLRDYRKKKIKKKAISPLSPLQNITKQKLVAEGNYAQQFIIHAEWVQLLIQGHQRMIILPGNSLQITDNCTVSRTKTSVDF